MGGRISETNFGITTGITRVAYGNVSPIDGINIFVQESETYKCKKRKRKKRNINFI